jgi:hypothetical protein
MTDLGAIARAQLGELLRPVGEVTRPTDRWRVRDLHRELAETVTAGDFNDEGLYDDEAEVYRRGRLTLTCPYCGRPHRPLLSPTTATIEYGWRWVGLDHREPYSEKIARCPRTRRWYRYTLYTPQ